jgi:hydrogenase maturation protein HypF
LRAAEFVYKLAPSLNLTGFFFNSSSGVTVEIEGSAAAAREFVNQLKIDPPQLAEIVELTVSELVAVSGTSFDIIESQENTEFALISPMQVPAKRARAISDTPRTDILFGGCAR